MRTASQPFPAAVGATPSQLPAVFARWHESLFKALEPEQSLTAS